MRHPASPPRFYARRALPLSAALALAQSGAAFGAEAEPAASGASQKFSGLMALFWQSADVFTALVALGSFFAVAIILRAVFEIRESALLPDRPIRALRERIGRGEWEAVRQLTQTDGSFVSKTLAAGMRPTRGGRQGAREAAELAASEESARWFRKIELLNVIGHLGPLLGLVGTVYGMIIAFAALGETGGQAGPGELSLGISKALFHTFLGLLLAIPSLLAYGYFRTVVDRVCTRAMVVAAELFESLPDEVFEAPPATGAPHRPREREPASV